MNRLVRQHTAAEPLNMYDSRSIVNNIVEDTIKSLCQESGAEFTPNLAGNFLNDVNGDNAFSQSVQGIQQNIDLLINAIDAWWQAKQ